MIKPTMHRDIACFLVAVTLLLLDAPGVRAQICSALQYVKSTTTALCTASSCVGKAGYSSVVFNESGSWTVPAGVTRYTHLVPHAVVSRLRCRG